MHTTILVSCLCFAVWKSVLSTCSGLLACLLLVYEAIQGRDVTHILVSDDYPMSEIVPFLSNSRMNGNALVKDLLKGEK